MKKLVFFVSLMILSLSMSTVFASDPKSTSDKIPAPDKTENKLSAEEVARLTKRVEEIRNMDKSDLTSIEKRALRKELREIKKNPQVIYISTGTLLLIIILILLL
jgi:hypothetical protein